METQEPSANTATKRRQKLVLKQRREDHHTPLMKNGISSVCNEKIWLTDYGASKAFDKFDKKIFNQKYSKSSRNPQVLEILNDGEKITVLKEE